MSLFNGNGDGRSRWVDRLLSAAAITVAVMIPLLIYANSARHDRDAAVDASIQSLQRDYATVETQLRGDEQVAQSAAQHARDVDDKLDDISDKVSAVRQEVEDMLRGRR